MFPPVKNVPVWVFSLSFIISITLLIRDLHVMQQHATFTQSSCYFLFAYATQKFPWACLDFNILPNKCMENFSMYAKMAGDWLQVDIYVTNLLHYSF